MAFPNTPNTLAIANSIAAIQTGMPTALLTFCPTMITASPAAQAVTPASMNGISVGMTLSIDVTNHEDVVVTATSGPTFSAVFLKNHGTNGVQWTVGTGNLTYTLVKVGAVTDPTDVLNYCAITFEEGMSERKASGWRIDDRPRFLIESGFDMTNSTVAEQSILTARDVLLPIYFAQISLNNIPGVYLTLMKTPDRALYKEYRNVGRLYRTHQFMVQAATEYNIPVSAV